MLDAASTVDWTQFSQEVVYIKKRTQKVYLEY